MRWKELLHSRPLGIWDAVLFDQSHQRFTHTFIHPMHCAVQVVETRSYRHHTFNMNQKIVCVTEITYQGNHMDCSQEFLEDDSSLDTGSPFDNMQSRPDRLFLLFSCACSSHLSVDAGQQHEHQPMFGVTLIMLCFFKTQFNLIRNYLTERRQTTSTRRKCLGAGIQHRLFLCLWPVSNPKRYSR